MTRLLKFIWIDDNPKRENAAKNLEKLKKVKVFFYDVRNKDLYGELQSIIRDRNQPDLLLIDDNLDKVTGGLIRKGSTTAEILRESWPDCPVVCITAVKLDDISLHRQDIYEEVVEAKNLSDHYGLLLSIAGAFNAIRRKPVRDTSGIIRLLKAPAIDKDRLVIVMPEVLKAHIKDKSFIMNLSRWVRHTLLCRPGFLYDKLWAATLLGVKETSFKKIQKHFIAAKYSGIFADDRNERWWQSQLRSIIATLVADKEETSPWMLGRSLPSIKKRDYSLCYACNKELPETVAYIDDTPTSSRAPMHLRCTVAHPKYENSLFYDEIRMMKAAE